MPYTYPLYPSPTSGSGTATGRVPGLLGMPAPAEDLRRQFPGLGKINKALSSDIFAGLEGQLSPGTVNALQDASAAWGAGAGMPGSQLARFRFGRNLGLTAEDLKNKAIQQYNQTIPTVSGTQTVSPALQNEIATQNALNLAAPDPTKAQSHAEDLFKQYLAGMGGPGGGIRFGGGGYSPPGSSSDWRTGNANFENYGPTPVGNAMGWSEPTTSTATADPFAGWQMSYGDAAASGSGSFYAGTQEGYQDFTSPDWFDPFEM